jgi:hypothetical protein
LNAKFDVIERGEADSYVVPYCTSQGAIEAIRKIVALVNSPLEHDAWQISNTQPLLMECQEYVDAVNNRAYMAFHHSPSMSVA